MFDKKTRTCVFAACIAAAVASLACFYGHLLADDIVERNSDDEFEASRDESAGEPESTESDRHVAWFDFLVFGDGSDAAALRVRFEELLERKTSAALEICALTDYEGRKLRIAGRGDIKRAFDRIERARLLVCGNGIDEPAHKRFPIDVLEKRLSKFSSAVRSDPFAYGSLFDKTLRHNLSFEKLARYKRWELRHAP
jgi:hypothetical protein